MPVTVNVVDAASVRLRLTVTLHRPVDAVTQERAPPRLKVPLTVAFANRCPVGIRDEDRDRASHLELLKIDVDPARSPTRIGSPPDAITVTARATVAGAPSSSVTVRVTV